MMRIRDEFLKAGLYVRVYSQQNRVYFSPPLIITKEEVDKALDLMYPIIDGLKDY